MSERDRHVYHAVLSEDRLINLVLPKPGDSGSELVGDYLVVAADTDTRAVPIDIIIDEDTGEPPDSISESFPQLSRDCLDNFIHVNRSSSAVLPQLTADLPVVMLDQKDLATLKAGGKFWSNFWTAYPDAIAFIQLSEVGFSTSGDQALVYVTGGRGELNGRSYLVFLMNETEWSIAGTRLMFVR